VNLRRAHPEVRRDLREATQYYSDSEGAALAQAFIAEFERTAALIIEYPEIGAVVLRDRRRFKLRRFPYWLIYLIEDGRVRILAVAHQSRRPDFWRDRE